MIGLSILYYSLHLHLKKKFGHKPFSTNYFNAMLGRHFLVPKPLRICVIEELKQKGLITVEDKLAQVVNLDINETNSAKTYYQEMGFF
jgi:hypothetical protein